jgi:hypothetical protein
MTDFTGHARARRRPVVLSEDATSRAIREIEAEYSICVRTHRPDAGIWKRLLDYVRLRLQCWSLRC